MAIITSISATSGSSNYPSPLQLLQNELRTEVSFGAISPSDQGALSSALTGINSSLQSDSPSSSAGGTNAAPGDLKSKIDSLIAGEVSQIAGRLGAVGQLPYLIAAHRRADAPRPSTFDED